MTYMLTKLVVYNISHILYNSAITLAYTGVVVLQSHSVQLLQIDRNQLLLNHIYFHFDQLYAKIYISLHNNCKESYISQISRHMRRKVVIIWKGFMALRLFVCRLIRPYRASMNTGGNEMKKCQRSLE